jgi:hypothetical protein
VKIKFVLFLAIAALAAGCNFTTASLDSLKTGKDKEAKQESASFKSGETLYAVANVANNPGGVKVVFNLTTEKGEKIPGSEVTVPMASSGSASYSMAVPPTANGKYILTADLLTDGGEKKGNKSVTVTFEKAAEAAPASSDDADDSVDDAADDKATDRDKK